MDSLCPAYRDGSQSKGGLLHGLGWDALGAHCALFLELYNYIRSTTSAQVDSHLP